MFKEHTTGTPKSLRGVREDNFFAGNRKIVSADDDSRMELEENCVRISIHAASDFKNKAAEQAATAAKRIHPFPSPYIYN
jgi:hypothetical protein